MYVIAATPVPWPTNESRKFVKDTKQAAWEENRCHLDGNFHLLEKDACFVENRLLSMFVIFSQ